MSRSLNLEGLKEKARSGAARMFGEGGEDLRRQDFNDTQTRLQFARIPRDQEWNGLRLLPLSHTTLKRRI